jgi:DNA-binding transcriptional regulator YiaG
MMTKPEFRAALTRNGFTVQSFADEFGVTVDTVYRWGGQAAIPRWACRVLALIDQHGPAHVLGHRPPLLIVPPDLPRDARASSLAP